MALKRLCILGLILGLCLNEAFPQVESNSASSTSIYYYDNSNQPTLCYFVNGQPLCGEEGKKAREADRERIKRLRDQTRQSIPGGGNFQGPRGDAQSLPQGDSPFQDDGPVIHPRNPSPNNYKGHVRPNNNKGHVVPPLTTPKPTKPPTPRPTRKPCPPPPTTLPPCPLQSTTTTASPCQQKVTTPSPCEYQTTDHPDIAEWKRTRHRNSRPSYQVLASYQNDQNQINAQQRPDFLRNRQAWISASSGPQNNQIQSDQPIQGNSEGWWISNKQQNQPNPRISSQNTIFRSSRTFENDQNGVARVPEIDVPRNGVILSVVSDQPIPSLRTKKQKPARTANSDDGNLATRTKAKNRGRLQLYQYFQRKARERKNNFQQNHY